MAIHNEWQGKIFVTHYSGVVAVDDVMQQLNTITSDGRTNYIRILDDFSQCTELQLDDTAMKKIRAFVRAVALSFPTAQIALVSQDDNIRYWHKRFQQELGLKGWQVELFESAKDATDWLTP